MVDTNLPADELAALEEKNARDAQVPIANDSDDDESVDEEPQYPGYKEMFRAEDARHYLGKSWMAFSAFFAIYYLLQFGLALMNANFYSQSHELRLTEFDYEIKTIVPGVLNALGEPVTELKKGTNVPLGICGPGNNAAVLADLERQEDAGELKVPLDVARRMKSAEVYDTAFLLMGIFHIIEWIRTIILLTSTCMGGVFLIVVYQLTAVNALYGFIAYVFAHYALFNQDGQLCSKEQAARSQFLIAEIIFFYVIYGISILFVLAFPKMAFELAHGAWRRRQAAKAVTKTD